MDARDLLRLMGEHRIPMRELIVADFIQATTVVEDTPENWERSVRKCVEQSIACALS